MSGHRRGMRNRKDNTITTSEACTAATEEGGLWDCECAECAAMQREADTQNDIVDSRKANEQQWDIPRWSAWCKANEQQLANIAAHRSTSSSSGEEVTP